jgi:hypothetical protein
MKKLTDDIKRVLAALGNQHAGEYMMPRDKADIVGYARSSANQTVKRLPRATGSASRRVAFLTDGRGEGAPLDYVIELCGRQQASVDLLVHGVVDTKRVDNLKKRLDRSGITCRSSSLGIDALTGLEDYISQHQSLIFLVAMPDDLLARRLTEELIPSRELHMRVPLVMIEDQPSKQPESKSA